MTREREARRAFGGLLRGHRRAHRWTQEELAERSGVSIEAVSLLERGRGAPRFGTVSRLADALGVSLAERAAFEAAAQQAADEAAGAGAGAGPATPPRGKLRRAPDSFVGRAPEVALVRARLAEHRLVTLTGPGGVGKTRLAVEAAHGLVETTDEAGAAEVFPDGVWQTELASLGDPDLVPRAVAEAVGAELDPDGPPGDALADALRPRRLLLVLDNCEHLVEACAALVEALLGACPGVRVLATSREPLGCAGEAIYRVPSLALPPAGSALDVEALSETAAVRLFVDRAAAGAPGFALTPRNAPAVAEVCRRLDGIPLALEFAAQQVRAMPVEALAARLDDRFRLLTGGRRTALERQQTLRALVDWSYALVAPAEQVLFTRLCVFAGAFTLEAAEAVCAGPAGGGGRGTEADVLAGLRRLVDTSFVLADADDGASPRGQYGAARYRLLETLREYGRERLIADPDQAARLRDRHLAYHLGLMEAAGVAPAGERHTDAVRRLEAARDDLWAALGWARDQEDREADRRLSDALGRLTDRLAEPGVRRVLTPLLSETRRLGLPAYATAERRLLAQTDPAVLDGGADLFWVIGDWPAEAAVARRREDVQAGGAQEWDALAWAPARLGTARPLLFREGPRPALRLLGDLADAAEALGDDALLLDVRLEEGYARWHAGECEPGRRVYAEVLTLLEGLRPRLGETAYRARRLAGLRGSGLVEHNADANARCLAFHEAALALARSARDGLEEAMARANVADGEWGCRRYGKALQGFDEALAAAAASFARVRSACVLGRGIVLGSMGRYEDAARSLTEGLATFRDLGDGWLGAYGLTYLSAVRAGQGDLDAALAASREAADLAERRGVGYPLALARVHLLWQEEVRAPGAPEHGPRIEAALREAQGLGLRGLAVSLTWLRLLHRAAVPGVPDDVLAGELAVGVRLLREAAPLKGAWELLGLQVLRVLRERRPGLIEPVADLEGLVEEEIGATERSLDPGDRRDYRATRRPWDDLR